MKKSSYIIVAALISAAAAIIAAVVSRSAKPSGSAPVDAQSANGSADQVQQVAGQGNTAVQQRGENNVANVSRTREAAAVPDANTQSAEQPKPQVEQSSPKPPPQKATAKPTGRSPNINLQQSGVGNTATAIYIENLDAILKATVNVMNYFTSAQPSVNTHDITVVRQHLDLDDPLINAVYHALRITPDESEHDKASEPKSWIRTTGETKYILPLRLIAHNDSTRITDLFDDEPFRKGSRTFGIAITGLSDNTPSIFSCRLCTISTFDHSNNMSTSTSVPLGHGSVFTIDKPAHRHDVYFLEFGGDSTAASDFVASNPNAIVVLYITE